MLGFTTAHFTLTNIWSLVIFSYKLNVKDYHWRIFQRAVQRKKCILNSSHFAMNIAANFELH